MPTRTLTQAELLAEAARTEVENTRSLAVLEALEEAAKATPGPVRARCSGPLVRWVSQVKQTMPDGPREEISTLEVRNMAMPLTLRPRAAPVKVQPAICAVTGLPARYRDPQTGIPFANAVAFRALRGAAPV